MEQGGIASLGIDWKMLIAQLINFAIVYFLLNRFAFKPIIKILEERRLKIDQSLKDAEAISSEKAALDIEVKNVLGQARTQADDIVSQTEKAMKAEEAKRRTEIDRQAATIIEDTKKQIEAMKATTKKELAQEIGLLVVKASERIIDQKLPEQTKKSATDDMIRELQYDR